MQSHTAQKRRRSPSDADTAVEAANAPKQARWPDAQPASSVEYATATGSSRMLNGHVHGDNIHGNTSTVINNFYAGNDGVSGCAATPKSPGKLSKAEREELLKSLRFSQLDARLTNLRKAQSRTCRWITQRKAYKEWLESDDLKAYDGLFWIKGNPGTGKSITMKFLYQGLDRQLRNAKAKDKLVISFFFNARGNEFEKSTLGLYRSLLFNLFKDEPDLQEALDHCHRGYHNILESGWQLQMLKEVFEESITLLQARGKRLYCFVDALDECPEDDVQEMITDFEDLVSNTDSRYFRVCFSSRHYPQISIRTKSVSFYTHKSLQPTLCPLAIFHIRQPCISPPPSNVVSVWLVGLKESTN
jgi:hypothetical protein